MLGTNGSALFALSTRPSQTAARSRCGSPSTLTGSWWVTKIMRVPPSVRSRCFQHGVVQHGVVQHGVLDGAEPVDAHPDDIAAAQVEAARHADAGRRAGGDDVPGLERDHLA